MTMTPVRPDEQVHEEPVTDPADGTSVRSPGFRLALLVALVAVLVAGLGSLAYLLSTRAVDAVGIGGDQAQVQGDREAVMAQTEQSCCGSAPTAPTSSTSRAGCRTTASGSRT